MRVTDGMMFDKARRNLAQARERAVTAQEQATTGRRVTNASDDPLATALAHRQHTDETRAEMHSRTADAGIASLNVADSALEEVGETLQRARELAVQASSGTMSAENRAATALEVTRLYEQIRALGNTESEGHYVFAGFGEDTPPFDNTGNYTGDGNVREVEVASGVRLPTGVSGATAFTAAGGVDLLDTLDSLRTALNTNSVDGIRASLDPLSTATSQVAAARSELGANMDAFDAAKAVAEKTKDRAAQRQTELVGIDPLDAYTALTRAQSALQAAVQIAAQLPLPGLAQR